MGTDLVRYKDRWAAGVKEMRDVFVRLESEGYSRESQQVCGMCSLPALPACLLPASCVPGVWF